MRKWILVLFLFGCSTVPVTGRRALHVVPDSQVNGLSLTSYQQLLKESKLADNRPEADMVRRVGQRIAAVSDQPDFEWEYHLIDDDKTVNAFCMPGGKVAVYTGILPYTKDETGLAVVMGHEIAHAIARHGSERLSQQLIVNFGAIGLQQALQTKPQATQLLANQAFGIGVGVGYILPFSRKQESEADRIGLVYMAKAGYDPSQAIGFWQRMSQSGGQKPPEFLSTHPSDQTRIDDLKGWLPEAQAEYHRRKK